MSEIFEFIVWLVTEFVPVVIWLVVAAYVWQLLHTMQAYYVGTSSLFICKRWLLPFRHAWETVRWHLPGGHERMAAFVRHRTSHDQEGRMSGRTRSWCHQAVRENKWYLECALDTLPRKADIVKTHIAILLWPLLTVAFVFLMSFERGRDYLFQSTIVGDLL